MQEVEKMSGSDFARSDESTKTRIIDIIERLEFLIENQGVTPERIEAFIEGQIQQLENPDEKQEILVGLVAWSIEEKIAVNFNSQFGSTNLVTSVCHLLSSTTPELQGTEKLKSQSLQVYVSRYQLVTDAASRLLNEYKE